MLGQLEWAVDVFNAIGEGAEISAELRDAAFGALAEWGVLDTLLFPPTADDTDALIAAVQAEGGEEEPDYAAWGIHFAYLYDAKRAADVGGFSQVLERAVEHAREAGILEEALTLNTFRDVLGIHLARALTHPN